MNIICIWERLLDTLDTSGGHVCVLSMLLLLGVVMVWFGVPKGEDVMMGAFGALLLALKAVQSNHARHQNGQGGVAPPTA